MHLDRLLRSVYDWPFACMRKHLRHGPRAEVKESHVHCRPNRPLFLHLLCHLWRLFEAFREWWILARSLHNSEPVRVDLSHPAMARQSLL